MLTRLQSRVGAWLRLHRGFAYLVVLFVALRLGALALLRPGGFITDFSDYDFYYTWGTLGPMGYRAYDNLWTAYPPLFPAIMLAAFEWSSRIPPWHEPRLFFHLIFGSILLLFEVGNLALIYRLAGRVARDEAVVAAAWGAPALHAATLYALCFVPLYTMLGWFEPMPLFFMLLGLELILAGRAYNWAGSAVAAGLGFLVKLTPILLLPVAIRYAGTRLSLQAARRDWFGRGPGNLARPLATVAIFAAVVVAVGYPLVAANPALALSSFRIQAIRPPWQSVWALLDGFYGYGLVPLDMRNLSGYDGLLWSSRLPWGWIGVAFAALYLWLYTRPYDWQRARTPLAFSAAGVILLFLYSKGWSPQFLLWIIAFVVVLLPTGRGIALIVLLSALNVVEANVFLIMLPDAHWLMATTVIARTVLLLLLLAEFILQIRPVTWNARLYRINTVATWGAMAAVLLVSAGAAPRVATAYWESRLAAHPCRAAVEHLRAEAGGPASLIVTQQPEVWRDLYPWLRDDYRFYVLDGYIPDGDPVERVLARVRDLADTEYWWVQRDDLAYPGVSPRLAYERAIQLPGVARFAEPQEGACRLDRMVHLADIPIATAAVAGGPIHLRQANLGEAQVGRVLPVVLYWQAETPVAGRYTVFTHLLDPAGDLVAQQDNWPVQGLAPTDTWQPGAPIRDPYRLSIPDGLTAGAYRLRVGLYDEAGRRPLTLAGGGQADHVEIDVMVVAP